MALSRSKKEELVAHYEESFADAAHAILVDYQGVGVPEITELRDRIRETGADYEVVKNRLALRAIDGKPLGELADSFDGPVAIAYSDDDIVGVAKVLTEFADERSTFTFRGGLLDGRPVAAEQIEEIASLPTREELITKLVYLLQSPITRLVRTLAAVPRDLVLVLNQIRENKPSEPVAATESAEAAEPAETDEPGESSEAADVAEATESTESTDPGPSDESSEVTEPDEPAESEESAAT